MTNAGNPEKPPKLSALASTPPEDIPVALRETPEARPKPRISKPMLLGGLAAVGVVALAAGGLVAFQLQKTQPVATVDSPSPAQPSPAPSATDDRLLGHYAYSEAPQSELEPIVADGSIKLRKEAAKAFQEMTAAAQQAGVSLVPISGFRSIADQRYLYFDVKAERAQNAAERAKVSAPPGYSEHHTGYATDIGDGSVPATNLRQDFDQTPAYRWLKENAARYSFELSFPKNNAQGVSYEPWHWRYVGDIQSLKTFYKARSQSQKP